MKNNKGFSLVELIIVIAIMAILVGVMAPQLIKYIEKTNVSSDTQLCDTVKSAITTAMMDPAVLAAHPETIPSNANMADVSTIGNSTDDTTFGGAVNEILGFTADEIDSHLKSAHNGNVQYCIASSTSVHVTVKGSDATGKKDTANGPDIYVD